MQATPIKEAAPMPLQRLIARRLYACAGYEMSAEFAALLAHEPLLLAALQRLACSHLVERASKEGHARE